MLFRSEKKGVILGLENYLSAEDNRTILDRVGSPAVQVYYDVGNSTDKGRDVVKEIRALGPRICEFHAKDAGYMLGQGRIDFHAADGLLQLNHLPAVERCLQRIDRLAFPMAREDLQFDFPRRIAHGNPQ